SFCSRHRCEESGTPFPGQAAPRLPVWRRGLQITLKCGRVPRGYRPTRGTRNLAFHQIARFVADYEIIPGVRFEIFDRKRHPPVFGIDASDDRFDLLAFLQNLSGMLDPPRPRNVGNVDESIDAVLDFDKGAEVSQVSDASLNSRTNLITV